MTRIIRLRSYQSSSLARFFSRPALLLILPLFIALPANSIAADPTAQIKSSAQRVIEILKDPNLQGEAKKNERRELLRQALALRFDFRALAKRSLGLNWHRLTSEEQDEFVRLFTRLLDKVYLDRIESYNNEKFVYLNQTIDEPYAEVDSKILTSKGDEYALNYMLRRQGEEWKIYDVVIEGVSLVANYRAQFNRVIYRFSYEELLRRIEKLLERPRAE